MATKNRRLLVEDGEEDLTWRIVEEELQETPPDCVVIKVQHAGICHSDVHMSQKNFVPNFQFPRVFGHEICGEVYSIGSAVSQEKRAYAVGDRVVVYPWMNCTDCDACRAGYQFCYKTTNPAYQGDKFVYGIAKDGGYQRFVVIQKPDCILKVPDGVPPDVACLVPCSGITAFNAVANLRESIEIGFKIKGQAVVAVIGAGGLALWAIQILKAQYPSNLTIVAIDIEDAKLEDAKAQGADRIFKWDPNDDIPTVVGKFIQTLGLSLDGAIDFTGIADCQFKAYAMLNAGGTLLLVGLSNKASPPFPVIATVMKNITIRGVNTGTRQQCQQLLDLILSKKVKPPPITAVRLDDVEGIIKQMRQNSSAVRGRCIVNHQL